MVTMHLDECDYHIINYLRNWTKYDPYLSPFVKKMQKLNNVHWAHIIKKLNESSKNEAPKSS